MGNISSLILQDKGHSHIIKAAGGVADKIDMNAYLVGGYVRDCLLHRKNYDIDIVVEGNGETFANELAKVLGISTVVDYNRFGTYAIPHPEIDIEIATARRESYTPDTRKPDVEFCSIDEDISRRDFTINAIAASIRSSDFGRLLDPYKGIQDLQKGIIMTPLDPDITFSDDPLRILRALRFAAQLDFSIASNVLDSITRTKDRLNIISWERIRDELIKSLRADKPSIAFYLMKEVGLLGYVFPELDIMSGVEKIDGKGHKDVFIHTLQVVDNAAELTDKMEIRFAALVHDIAKPQTKKYYPDRGWTFHGHEEIGKRMMIGIAKRLKLSNELRDYLMSMIKLHLRPIALAKEGVTDTAIRRIMNEAGDDIDDLMTLCRADITTKNPSKVRRYMKNFEKVEELMKDVKLRDEMKMFQSPVRGHEIMKMFNLSEGPEIGRIKGIIEDAILDGDVQNDYDSVYSYILKNKNSLEAS
mgnify:CR=1 FL=1